MTIVGTEVRLGEGQGVAEQHPSAGARAHHAHLVRAVPLVGRRRAFLLEARTRVRRGRLEAARGVEVHAGDHTRFCARDRFFGHGLIHPHERVARRHLVLVRLVHGRSGKAKTRSGAVRSDVHTVALAVRHTGLDALVRR